MELPFMNGYDLIHHLKTAVYPETGAPLVAFFGDSVTHGAFECLDTAGADCVFDFDAVYHAVLARELRRVNPWLPVSILDAGVSGGSARSSLARIERDVISHRPDLCVVNFALNDVNDPLEVYRASLAEILDRLSEAGIPTVLLTPNMLNTYVHPDTVPKFRAYAAVTAEYQNSGRMDAYVDAARELAAERSLPIADAYAKWKAMAAAGQDTTVCLANYINHPTRELHRLFAETLFETLQALVARREGGEESHRPAGSCISC